MQLQSETPLTATSLHPKVGIKASLWSLWIMQLYMDSCIFILTDLYFNLLININNNQNCSPHQIWSRYWSFTNNLKDIIHPHFFPISLVSYWRMSRRCNCKNWSRSSDKKNHLLSECFLRPLWVFSRGTMRWGRLSGHQLVYLPQEADLTSAV